MKNLFAFISVSFLLASCSSDSKHETTGHLPASDSSSNVTMTSPLLDKVIAKFRTKSTLPFLGDTTLLFKFNGAGYGAPVTFDSLGSGEVHILDTNWFRKSAIAYNSYDIRNFYTIDSIKATGTYQKWCDSLDVGMTKFANAYALFRIDKDAETTLLIWATYIASYEADPFSTQTSIYCTVVHKGLITQSFMLANYVAAGDPPSMFESNLRGVLNTDGTFELDSYEQSEDLDEPFAEETRSHYSYVLKDGMITIVSERAGKPEKVKREREKAAAN